MDEVVVDVQEDIIGFLSHPNAYRSVLILVTAILVAYVASKYLAQIIIVISQKVALRSEKVSNDAKAIRLRQVETYLSITVAIVRGGCSVPYRVVVQLPLVQALSLSSLPAKHLVWFFVTSPQV